MSVGNTKKLERETNNAAFNPQELYYLETRDLKYSNLPTVSVNVLRTASVTTSVKPNNITIPKNFEPIVKFGIERKKPIAYIMVPHYIQKDNGDIEQLLDYTLNIEETPVQNKINGNRTYAANSVLSSGTFYKINIASQGIYKIDYDFIANKLGVNPSTITPANIRVYGNGGEMLSENNAVVPSDDLAENPIQLVDGNDGQFNQGDYILFYANGPHTIIKDSLQKSFTHAFNVFSEVSTYFINFDKGAGKRIANHPLVSNPNATVTSFNEFLFHEKDSVNLGRFGKEFWGDEMSNLPGRGLSKSFTFNLPNLDATSPVIVKTRTGAVTRTTNSGMKISANNAVIQNINYEVFGENYYDPVIQIKEVKTTLSNPTDNIVIKADFVPGSSDAVGYIGYIEIMARRNLVFNGYLNFADWNAVGAGVVANYVIQNANSTTEVWDITNPLSPIKMQTSLDGTTLSFNQEASKLHRFVAINSAGFKTPTYFQQAENQNLHSLINIDYVVIAPPSFKAEALRLAQHHQSKRGITYVIATPQEIYNEFSSGSQDISAIRNFIKMLYDKSSMDKLPSSVLLFGDASYDYKNRLPNNTNLVPTHETNQSNNKILGFCSDDFYGFLDDIENLNDYTGVVLNTLDIGVGRIPVANASDAAKVVNKILNYDSPNSFGPWKNNMTFNADNGDGARHLDDGEIMAGIVGDSLPVYNLQMLECR